MVEYITIGENISKLRKEKGITQDELAGFLGVTKASVSKWEKGSSYPDITLIPQIASYFDRTLDELMGYKPMLNKEQIMRIHQELKEAYAKEPFDEAMKKTKEYVRRYYSCYPFLFQVCSLWLNHYNLAKPQEQNNILNDICKLCSHIIEDGNDRSLYGEAMLLKSTSMLLMGDGQGVIDELGPIYKQYENIFRTKELLINAYQIIGNVEEAKKEAQINLYVSLLSMISMSTKFLELIIDDGRKYDETVKRITALIETYQIKELHPNCGAVFFYQAALGYIMMGNIPKAIEELELYVEYVLKLLLVDEVTLHGDEYFTEVEHWLNSMWATVPRSKELIWQTFLDSMEHPLLQSLQKQAAFIQMKEKVKKAADGNTKESAHNSVK